MSSVLNMCTVTILALYIANLFKYRSVTTALYETITSVAYICVLFAISLVVSKMAK